MSKIYLRDSNKVNGQYRSSMFLKTTDKTYVTIKINPKPKIFHIGSAHFIKMHTIFYKRCIPPFPCSLSHEKCKILKLG